MRREAFKFWDLARLIFETLRYIPIKLQSYCSTCNEDVNNQFNISEHPWTFFFHTFILINKITSKFIFQRWFSVYTYVTKKMIDDIHIKSRKYDATQTYLLKERNRSVLWCTMRKNQMTWWSHMATLPALLALCAGNPPFTIGFPSQRASKAEFWCSVC